MAIDHEPAFPDWLGYPPGKVRLTSATRARPRWLRRLWDRLRGRRTPCTATYVFEAAPGASGFRHTTAHTNLPD